MARKKRNYDEVYATRSLLAKTGVSIDPVNKVVAVGANAELGIRSLGKLDYLIHYCGYVRVNTGSSSNKPKITNAAVTYANAYRDAKTDKKLGKLKHKD
nr:MAG TPA: hypothetical protein [Crassvirales sp.]